MGQPRPILCIGRDNARAEVRVSSLHGWRELDGAALFDALVARATTVLGRHALSADPLACELGTVRRRLDEVDDVVAWTAVRGEVPVAGIADVSTDVRRAARGGALDGPSLRAVGFTLDALHHLAARLAEHADAAPTLARYQPDLPVAPATRATLAAAFDDTGALSARTWPELGILRGRIASLHQEIRTQLDQLVRGDALADVLQDRFVTQRNDRYVLPVRANADRRAVGIVHGTSQRGATVFVEPHEIVERNNALRLAESALEEAERRILEQLSAAVGAEAAPILRALDAAGAIDAACARASLSAALDGVRPAVHEGGVVSLRAARHPLLALRGVRVVPHDLRLDDAGRVLVVSGPNTGGKTVVLKTVGLCVALVRLGVRVPAAEGARVDLFPRVRVIAGDAQDVADDASTFSAHVDALRAALGEAGPGALVLVDEIASGTDPTQGAALAAAVLEAVAARGGRAVVTTHLGRLKAWAASAQGVVVAGMAFEDGRPTWRLVPGVQGGSHALAVARARGLDAEVIARATDLVEHGDRELAGALDALEAARAEADAAHRRLLALEAQVAAQRDALAVQQAAVDARRQALEDEVAAGFRARLDAAERAVGEVVAALQRAPDQGGAVRARATIQALRGLAPAPPVEAAPVLAEGDRVRVGRSREPGTVVGVGRRLSVRTDRGLVVRVAPADVVRDDTPAPSAPPIPVVSPAPRPAAGPLEDAVPHAGNTLDLRGQRVDDGLAALEAFVDRAVRDGEPIVFVLHGHGTGALKQAVRQALRDLGPVARHQPARADQGGDAYTVVALR